MTDLFRKGENTLYYKDETPFAKERSNRTGYYNPELVSYISNKAKKMGLDPYVALGMAMQETNLGKTNEVNPFHVLIDKHFPGWGPSITSNPKAPEEVVNRWYANSQNLYKPEQTWWDSHLDTYTDKALDLLKKGYQKYKNPLKAIQSFNGLGVLSERDPGSRNYGKTGEINLGQTYDYANRVQAFANSFRQSPEFENLIRGQFNGQY
jgi:hypothetical protein